MNKTNVCTFLSPGLQTRRNPGDFLFHRLSGNGGSGNFFSSVFRKDFCTFKKSGSGGADIIYKQDILIFYIRRFSVCYFEGTCEIQESFFVVLNLHLRGGVSFSFQDIRPDRYRKSRREISGDIFCQYFRLVESAPAEPPFVERDRDNNVWYRRVVLEQAFDEYLSKRNAQVFDELIFEKMDQGRYVSIFTSQQERGHMDPSRFRVMLIFASFTSNAFLCDFIFAIRTGLEGEQFYFVGTSFAEPRAVFLAGLAENRKKHVQNELLHSSWYFPYIFLAKGVIRHNSCYFTPVYF